MDFTKKDDMTKPNYNEKQIIEKARKLFDPDYYFANNIEICNSYLEYNGDTLFEHFIKYGWQEGRDPNSSFSTKRYLAENQTIIRNKINPLFHYIVQGMPMLSTIPKRTIFCSKYLNQINENEINDLFDDLFYFSVHFECHIGTEKEHYANNQLNSFNPLFDIEYYLKQLAYFQRNIDPLEHYLTQGWKDGISPHPLFDLKFYLKQLDNIELNEPPLLHYLNKGWRGNLSPHPLFDPQHYYKEARLNNYTCPMIHYLISAGKYAEPHYLFNDNYYRNKQGLEFGQDIELLHYLKNPDKKNISTHPYFGPVYYLQRLQRMEILEGKPPGYYITEAEKEPLIHYVDKGWKLLLSPSPLFDPSYYKTQLEDRISGDPIRHFLTFDGFIKNSGHSLFDNAYYKMNSDGYRENHRPAILHFLNTPKNRRTNFHPFFDVAYYIERNKDIVRDDLCPMEHFLRYGIHEGRIPNKIFNELYVLKRDANSSFIDESPLLHYMKNIKKRPVRILFTSHEASRTGAPAIILQLIRKFSKLPNVECITILNRGGDLLNEFEKTSFIYVLKEDIRGIDHNMNKTELEVKQVLSYFSDNVPIIAICNTMDSRPLAEVIHRLGIPIIFLIHEFPEYFTDEEFDRVYNISNEVVLPSKFIDQRARLKGKYPTDKIHVQGQGLLNDRFGELGRRNAREKVINEIGISENVFIVLGCGTVDLRKGIDYFCLVARKVLQKKSLDKPVYFIWLGGGDFGADSTYRHLAEENNRLGVGRHIKFIGERENVEPYFVAADLFLMTSRSDPFPCVVHEAMAAGNPVITFEENGGAAELVGDCGYLVPLGDTDAMADKVLELTENGMLYDKLSRNSKNEIRTNWKSEDYFKFIQKLILKTTNVSAEHFPLIENNKNNKIPIFFLTPDWGISGVNTFTLHLVKGLIEKGYDAKIVFTKGRYSHFTYKHGQPVIPDVPKEFIQLSSDRKILMWRELLDWFVNASPCILIPNYDYAASYISKILPPNIGVIGIAHSDDIEHYEHVYRLGHFWQRIVGVTDHISRKICDLNQTFTKKLNTIHYGIDVIDEFDVESKFKNRHGAIKIVYSGRFIKYQKQIYRYVELVNELNHRNINFDLTMFGHGEEFDHIFREMYKFRDRVHLPGRVDQKEILNFLKDADLFVLLSDFEGLPISMLEAMSVGCVPLVYDMDSGINEVIRSSKNGIIVQDRTVTSAADIISTYAVSPQDLLPLAKASRQTLFDMGLTVEGMTNKYITLIEEVSAEINNKSIDRSQFYHGKNREWRSLGLETELRINHGE